MQLFYAGAHIDSLSFREGHDVYKDILDPIHKHEKAISSLFLDGRFGLSQRGSVENGIGPLFITRDRTTLSTKSALS